MKKRRADGTNEEFEARISLAPERILVRLDYHALSSLLKDSPEELCRGLEELERTIQDGNINHLDTLCEKGCDRRAVLWLLHPFSAKPIFRNARWSNERGAGPAHVFLGITSKLQKRLVKKLET